MQDRVLLFWGVCIPLRLALARYGDSSALRLFGLVIGTRWMVGLENGNEGVFGGKAWWKEERPVHGAFWVAYGMTGSNKFLYTDTLFGAANWVTSSGVL
jgi:hypothetical protein